MRHSAAPWTDVDLTTLAAGERDARLTEWLGHDRASPFDVTTAPLVRWALIRMSDEDHRLVLTNHHLLLDGWSTPLLMQELLAKYEQTVGR